MARNETRELTNHMAGAMGTVGAAALANPLGMIMLVIIATVVMAAVAVLTALWETREAWLPYALVGVLLGSLVIVHGILRAVMSSRRGAWRATGAIVLVCLGLGELATGIGGVAASKVIGVNPEAVAMGLGVPVTHGIALAIENQRYEAQQAIKCRKWVGDAELFSVWFAGGPMASWCEDHISVADRRASCERLRDDGSMPVRDWDRAFCMPAGVAVPLRNKASR